MSYLEFVLVQSIDRQISTVLVKYREWDTAIQLGSCIPRKL